MTFVQNPGSLNPVFDYSSRDYVSILTDLLNRKQVYLPEWTSVSNNDFGISLLQEFAYACDILHYYIDRLAGEAFIQTATQPQSILNLAALIGYTPYLSSAASVTLTITISQSLGSYPVVIPAGTQFATVSTSTQSAIIFTTTEDVSISNNTSPSQPVAYVNTVAALQGIQYTSETVATSDGSINQAYQLQNNPVTGNEFTVYVDLGIGPQPWTYASTLVGAGPFDYVYTNFVDANQNFYIVLGDGVNGYVPPLGSPITCTYMTNDGATGNVGANTITVYYAPPPGDSIVMGVTAVTNAAAASGGAAQESISSIQSQAPASLATNNRAITVNDLNTICKNQAGVAWASANEETYQLINLFIAPNGGGNLTATQIAALQTTLDAVVMANTTLTILSPTYVNIDISAQVVAFANYSNQATQQLVISALNNLLALGNTGFGFRVTLGLVYETILGVQGVNYAQVEQISAATTLVPTPNLNCSGLTREVLCSLTSALTNGQTYTSLTVTQVPQNIAVGDSLVINNGTTTQTVQASAAVAGDSAVFTIPVYSFVANANYPAATTSLGHTTVTDITVLEDAVTLTNEIPQVGTFNINVTGGTTP